MVPLRILIAEDESLVAMDMTEMLQRLGYEVFPAAYNYEEAVQSLETQTPDLLLADIDLGGEKTGIDLAELVRARYRLPIVFITSHADKTTVAKAAATKPNGYLVKPFVEDDLFTSIEVALANYTETQKQDSKEIPFLNEVLFIKADAQYVKVNVADILWLESDHNYIYIITDKGKHVVRSNFRDFMVYLPEAQFLQVHKSYIINLKKVDSFSHTEVLLNKIAIPLSRNFKQELFDKIKRVQ